MIKDNVKWWSISSQLIIDEAIKLWFEIDMISQEKNLFFIIWNWQKYLFKNIDCSLNSALWFKLTKDKELTYKILWEDFYTPKSVYISSWDKYDVKNIWVWYPLVVKPSDTDHWDWVTVNINDEIELQKAIDFAFLYSKKIIVQNFVVWFDHRLLVVWNKVSAVAMRKPPYIVWNGINSIKSLIEEENKNPLRWDGDHSKPLTSIKIDDELITCLSLQNYSLDSILEDKKEIFLRRNANLSTWGFSVDLTDIIHEENKKIAIEAAKKLELKVAWVDIVCSDISKPLKETSWIIIEVNNTPWLRMHHFPTIWTSRNPALDILKLKFWLK